MEQVSEPARQIDAAPQKMSKGQIIGMVALTIIALAGVAFGVFGMVGKNEAEKERDLAIKITEATGKVTDIVTDKITSVDENGTVTEITDTNVTTEAVNPEDYIYIGEWGIKIKKGDFMFTSINYAGYNDGDEIFHLNGVNSNLLNKLNTSMLYMLPSNVRIVRSTKSIYPLVDRGIELSPAYNDGEYNYFVAQSGGYNISDELTPYANDIQSSLSEMVDILENTENYSKI